MATWCILMSHVSSCFKLMVRHRCGANPNEVMDSRWLQCAMQASCIMAGSEFPWQEFGLLVSLSRSLTGDCFITLLFGHLHPFMNTMYPYQWQVYSTMSWAGGGVRSGSELVWGVIWILMMTDVTNIFTQHEPNQSFMEHSKVVYLFARSCIYKYQGSVNSYWDVMAERLVTSSDYE